MWKVIYSMVVSLDGFVAGPDGEIDWSAPDEELHRFHNQQMREIGAPDLVGFGLCEPQRAIGSLGDGIRKVRRRGDGIFVRDRSAGGDPADLVSPPPLRDSG
jgi:hypothetical protein